MITGHIRGIVLLFSVLLTGCAASNSVVQGTGATQSPPRTTATSVSIQSTAQGLWEAVAGDIGISESAVGKIYNYDWYAIETTSPNTVVVIWDNGLTCGRTEGRIEGNEIRVVDQEVVTVFLIDGEMTTVTFQQGEKTWTKQLVKKHNSPGVPCF